MSARHLVAIVFCAFFLFPFIGCTVAYVEPPRYAVHDEYAEPQPPPPPPTPDIDFYELGEHGEWIDVHPFGLVWRPFAVHDWRPYLDGHWVWTDWGWTWVSYEPFGWAVYHYGNWHLDSMWGWVWLPGYEWEPSRVQWIWYDDYVCWSPLPPSGYGVPDPWAVHTDVWIVVHTRHFTHHDLHRFRVKHSAYKQKFRVRSKVYRKAPLVKVVEKHTKRKVRRVHLDVKSYKSGKRTYKKVVLPVSEKKIVEQYRPKVRKRALKPAKEGKSTYKNRTGYPARSHEKPAVKKTPPKKKTEEKVKQKTKTEKKEKKKKKSSAKSKTKKKKQG